MIREEMLYQATVASQWVLLNSFVHRILCYSQRVAKFLLWLSFRVSDVYINWIAVRDKSVYQLLGKQQQELLAMTQ